MREMLVEQRDIFYYVTLMNENYAQPDLPGGVEADVIRGCYKFKTFDGAKLTGQRVTLMGSGAILTEVLKAAQALAAQGIASDVFSVTSWSELARDGMARDARLLAGDPVSGSAFITQQLTSSEGPILAATDYVRAVPESIRAYVPEGRRYVSLGTDGFGRSDTRAALRAYFHVDAASIVQAALQMLQA
jgi:pyruvate dehydrogenase E1 component